MTDINKFIDSLQNEINGDVLSDDYSLGIYATDASVYQIRPQAVVLPKDEADVIAAVKLAGEFNVSILPRGGGTSLAGQTVGQSMVMDFSKYMNNILEFNASEKWVIVQPGIVYDVLNTYLKPHGLQFAPDPATSSRANIGGMIGNNSSGTKSILYGKTVDHVVEAKVLLADGNIFNLKACNPEQYAEKESQSDREGELYKGFKEVIENNREEIERRYPKVMRRVGGYNLDEFVYTDQWNLSKLITGSEGTLATILEVKLNLEPLPQHKSVCVVHFSKLLQAIEAVDTILEFNPSAVEILDKTVIDLSRENLTTKRGCHFIEGNPAAILIVEFYSEDKNEVLQRPATMIDKLKKLDFGYAWPLFPEGKDYNDVWIIRKKGLGLMLGIKGDKKPIPFIEDACVPTSVLPEYIDRVLKICNNNGADVAMYAHASVGVIHVRPILDLRQSVDIERFEKISRETFNLVKEYEGSWSGEHGDGLVRSAYMEQFFGSQIYNALKEIKTLFDPGNLMNPGKIIDSPPITENLRYGPSYKDQSIETTYHFRSDNSFTDAVHMCTGVGECRKILGGTMCPSYKATRDEEHSTRGRANALRLAMSDQLNHDGLGSERLREVLDLCLSCKACKSECPSNVDMAKLKGEVSQLYYSKHGTTLRDKLIKNSSSTAAKFSGPFAGFINALQLTPAFRITLERLTGFDKRRLLPAYARQPFYQWFRKNAKENPGKTVALFADTYLNYHEPKVGISAYDLLTSCGYNVVLANGGCCQRPKISHGFLREAKEGGLKTARNLNHFFTENIPVLVCEPGCASALTDDLPDLIEDEELANNLTNGVFMIDQFLYQEFENGNLDINLSSDHDSIVIHGHCHQKALYGTSAMKDLLHKVNGLNCMELDSGCCGMAGSFGYEKEHYDLSNNIGSEVLFPAINNLDDRTTIVASGKKPCEIFGL
ncbi:FAD-binding and (Fe-S)-binding domain-containing protein [Bacteroidota bacterium]